MAATWGHPAFYIQEAAEDIKAKQRCSAGDWEIQGESVKDRLSSPNKPEDRKYGCRAHSVDAKSKTVTIRLKTQPATKTGPFSKSERNVTLIALKKEEIRRKRLLGSGVVFI